MLYYYGKRRVRSGDCKGKNAESDCAGKARCIARNDASCAALFFGAVGRGNIEAGVL